MFAVVMWLQGTPAYLPPEVLQNGVSSRKVPYDASAADLWCCGIALYAMLIGQYPFQVSNNPAREELLEVLQKMRQHQYHVPSTLTPDCRRLLKGLLTANPQQRLTINDIQTDPWFEIDLSVGLFEDNNVYAGRQVTPLQSEEEIRQLMDSVLAAYS
jgi:carbon catabolite-derepressing protein kinase